MYVFKEIIYSKDSTFSRERKISFAGWFQQLLPNLLNIFSLYWHLSVTADFSTDFWNTTLTSAVLTQRLFTTSVAVVSWCCFSSHSCFYICIVYQLSPYFLNVYFQQIFGLFPLDFAYVFLLIQTGWGEEDKMLWGKAFLLYSFLLLFCMTLFTISLERSPGDSWNAWIR